MARRAKPSVVPGHVKLTMTLDMRRERHLLGDIATHPEQFNPDKGAQCYREALALAADRKMQVPPERSRA